MVCAKFHIVGEDGEWFRIRVQEEVQHHGLEGSVVLAEAKTLAVIVEGDGLKIRKFYGDVVELCPKGILCSKLSLGAAGQAAPRDQTLEYVMEILKEIERKMTRMDQKLNRLVALQEGRQTSDPAVEGEKSQDTRGGSDEVTAGFASMFGE